MISFLLLNKILVFVINIVAIWIGVLVYRNNPKKRVNQILASMVVLMLCWVDFAYLARILGEQRIDLAMISLRIAWFVSPLFYIFVFFLAIHLIDKKRNYRVVNIIFLIVGLCCSLAIGFSDLIIKNIEFVGNDLTIIYGVGMFPLLGIIFFVICIALYIAIKEYLISSERQKTTFQYFLIGASIFYIANIIFNIFLPLFFRITHLYWIGDYSSTFLIGLTGYAIVKEKLFGIKVIVTQLFIGVLTLLLLINFVTAQSLFEYVWKGALFIAFIIFSFLLIKSVKREIKQKERIDRFAKDLKVANVSLELANKKLKKLDKAKSEFISIASHQLRTPLTAIKGYVSMILEGDYGNLPKETLTPLTNVYESNQRLVKLVNSLLNLSRLEAGRIVIQKANFSVQDLIAELVRSFVVQLQGKDVKLKFKKPRVAIPDVFADRAKIAEVISNLFDNAIKYTPKGSISATLEYKKSINKVLITVSDTGAGMTKEEMTKLFKTFSRAGAGNKFWTEGTGLGLYVARKFVEMHRGRIWAESKGKEKGSKFLIELPVK
ncbi:MAG: HAMP domain-containing histidine kinase [Parcubacteria group bacterium]|nr:HAMP domain-containing histidine kinase [Parcubacteria group bacterium]